MLKDLLNKANNIMGTANRTTQNVNQTRHNINSLGGQNRQMQQREANRKREEKAKMKQLEWRCECKRKNHGNFCDSCGKSKPACASCGAPDTGSKFCAQCGAAMASLVENQPDAPEEEEAVEEAAPVLCSKCGVEVCGVRFCPECGTPSGQ
jgi:membrane protease subunit (stomatin/prohibitin family)